MKNWATDLDNISSDFISSFGGLTTAQLNWKPDPKTWSIAQNIDHLIKVNETYYPVLDALKKGTYTTPFTAKIGFLVSFFGKTILNAVNPDRKKRMETFPIWTPTASQISGDILAQFERHQQELKQIIESSADLITRGVIISSPANRNIVYSLETAFDIIVSHEKRHFEQTKEVLGVLKT